MRARLPIYTSPPSTQLSPRPGTWADVRVFGTEFNARMGANCLANGYLRVHPRHCEHRSWWPASATSRVPAGQISARMNRYRDLFERDSAGRIRLSERDAGARHSPEQDPSNPNSRCSAPNDPAGGTPKSPPPSPPLPCSTTSCSPAWTSCSVAPLQVTRRLARAATTAGAATSSGQRCTPSATPRQIRPSEFRDLPRYGVGLTDVCKHASGNDCDLMRGDFDVDAFWQRIRDHRPGIVAFNGKKAAQAALRLRAVSYGPQQSTHADVSVFVLPSTSGTAHRHWDISVWHDLARQANRG
jgi:hypothetical protein